MVREGIVEPGYEIKGPELLAAMIALVRAGGFESYKIMLIVVNYLSRLIIGSGLSVATNATLAKCLSILSGPIGWAITGVWAVIDVAGPAYRVTIPATIYIAIIRQKEQ